MVAICCLSFGPVKGNGLYLDGEPPRNDPNEWWEARKTRIGECFWSEPEKGGQNAGWQASKTYMGLYLWPKPEEVTRMPFWKPEKCIMPMVEICYLGCWVCQEGWGYTARKEPKCNLGSPQNAHSKW